MLTSTKDAECHYIKALVHGPSGAGKTRLSATIESPLIISAEAGLLSLRDYDLPVWTVKSLADMEGAYSEALKDCYKWVVLDSISEIAEVCLSEEKKETKDGRKAYGEMQDVMSSLIRTFRDIPKNVYMSAKQEKVKDEITGALLFGPSAPGVKMAQSLPYFFDLVFALHNWKNEDGIIERALQTQRDAQYEAKDRSGALDYFEPADLGAIERKILGKDA